jgi:hypothetical protein
MLRHTLNVLAATDDVNALIAEQCRKVVEQLSGNDICLVPPRNIAAGVCDPLQLIGVCHQTCQLQSKLFLRAFGSVIKFVARNAFDNVIIKALQG